METNVKVTVEVEVPVAYIEGNAVESFVEKLAKDIVADALHAANKRIGIVKASAVAKGKGLVQG